MRISTAIFVNYLFFANFIASALKIEVISPVKLNTSTTITTTNAPSTTTPVSTTISTTTSTKSSTSTRIAVTTATPSTTSSIPDNVTSSSNSATVKTLPGVPYGIQASYRCDCDLKLNRCDVNCCCDKDCTLDMKRAFICDDSNSLHGAKYQQGLPSCKVNDGWLCIFKDNSKSHVYEVYDERIETNRLHNWPNYFSTDYRNDEDREHYVIGDQLMIYVTSSGEVKPIDLPYALLNSHCHVVEPVRHLLDVDVNCTMSSIDFQNFYLSLLESTETHKLLRNRKGIINNSAHLIDKSYYIDFNVSICDADTDQKTCVTINNDTVIPSENCWKLTFYIYHNFTVLTSANISLLCTDTKQDQLYLTKHMNVVFIQTNETVSFDSQISGKYGYRIGNPVIVGQYIPINDAVDDSEKISVISYFHENATIRSIHKGILLPKSVEGYCSEALKDRINYFENTLTQCFVTSNDTGLNPDSNFTQFCESLQRNAFHHMIGNEHFIGDLDLYVSELGWPLNSTAYWIKAELKNFEFNKISGMYYSDTNTFLCSNMLLSIRYEFITARISILGAHHQNVIKKFTADFGNRVNLRFKVDEDLKLPIYVYVRFYDATKSNSNSKNQINIILSCIFVVLLCFFI